MDKLVYLFELDSVRRSESEIFIGQQALFEEIVGNGNQVVLTFNQLTDSRAFLHFLRDENTFHQILELFKLGSLIISRYEGFRTVSQYVQNSIETCLSKDYDCFLFSALPISHEEKHLLRKIKDALVYSDLTLITDEYINCATQKDRNRHEYIVRFVRLMLFLSVEELAINPQKNPESDKCYKFTDFLDIFIKMYDNGYSFFRNCSQINDTADCKDTLQEAVALIKKTHESMCLIGSDKISLERRSNWTLELSKHQEANARNMAIAIIDLCYNYTVEDSIKNISKHYEDIDTISFYKDFDTRLSRYWDTFRDGTHNIYGSIMTNQWNTSDDYLAWDTAVRVVSSNNKYFDRNSERIASLYESEYKKEVIKWNFRVFWLMSMSISIIALYVLVFILCDYTISILQDIIIPGEGYIPVDPALLSIISIVVFSLLGSIISYIIKIPDILDNMKKLRVWVKDIVNYMRIDRNIAHKNM